MKTMFQKSLVALAVAATGFSAVAAEVKQDATLAYADVSKQFLTSSAAPATVTAKFSVKLNAEYKNDDVVEVKFSAPVASSWTASDVIAAKDATGTALVNLDGKAVVTLGWLSTSTDGLTVRFRVTDVNKAGGNSTKGTYLVFTDVKFATATVLGTKEIKATYAATTATGGFALDSEKTNTAKILAAVDQFSAENTNFKGEITLASKRTALTGQVDGSVDLTDDVATLRPGSVVTLNEVTYTLEGDFSWIKDIATTAGLDAGLDVITPIAGCTYKSTQSTKAKLVFTCDEDFGFDFDITKNTAAQTVGSNPSDATKATTLNATKYTITSNVDYTTGDYDLQTREAIGEWTVEGVTVDVPYLVYGVNGDKDYNIIATVTNTSAAAGKVTIDLFDAAGKGLASSIDAGSVASKGQLNLVSAIKTGLGSYVGKFSARVFVEVPAGQAEVYSAYQDKETAERAIVINTSN